MSGCGTNDRLPLQGTVTFDGKPLATGVIQFIPGEGTAGPSAGGEIQDGHYTVSAEKGVFAGTFRVEIISNQKTGTQTRSAGGQVADDVRNIVPAQYNVASTLSADVSSEDGNSFDFELRSK